MMEQTWGIHMKNKMILMRFMLFFTLISSAYSTMYFVSVDGSDVSGDGSPQNPFASIQNGIDMSSSSNYDTVVVSEGTYHEN